MWIHGRELRPLQSPPYKLPVWAARWAERVNDETVKILNFLIMLYFIWKWEETFEKLQFLFFAPKQYFYLTNSAREYFEKLAFKKQQRNFNWL